MRARVRFRNRSVVPRPSVVRRPSVAPRLSVLPPPARARPPVHPRKSFPLHQITFRDAHRIAVSSRRPP